MLKVFSSLSMVALIALASAAYSEDWPEFRGPTGQGISMEHNLPVEWSDDLHGTSKNIVWKTAIPGEGWSSPVLRDGRIYLTSAVGKEGGENQGLNAICVEAATGKIRWNVEVFTPAVSVPIHAKNSHASPTPLIDGDRLYVHFGHQGTACLDLAGRNPATFDRLKTEFTEVQLTSPTGQPLHSSALLFAEFSSSWT